MSIQLSIIKKVIYNHIFTCEKKLIFSHPIPSVAFLIQYYGSVLEHWEEECAPQDDLRHCLTPNIQCRINKLFKPANK
jgi:hypothetical protein